MSSFLSLVVQAAAVMRALAVLVVLWLVSPAQAVDNPSDLGPMYDATPFNPPSPQISSDSIWQGIVHGALTTVAPPPPRHDPMANNVRARYGTAKIYVTSRFWGGTIIHIDGFINEGDEETFGRVASQYPAGTVVEADSRGGRSGGGHGHCLHHFSARLRYDAHERR
jgi:hypothetical protein